MKIMTTAAFSVMLLGKRRNGCPYFCWRLAWGLCRFKLPPSMLYRPKCVHEAVGSAAAAAPKHFHVMFPLKGFAAVIAACFTSGLAGVYFEMVLKNSKADLWTFGAWAWATVSIQVFGGLITAVVIKYSDNILKGFLFGASIVLAATWIYNQPAPHEPLVDAKGIGFAFGIEKNTGQVLTMPVGRNDPIIGEKLERRPSTSGLSSLAGSSQSLSNLFGLSASAEKECLAREREEEFSMLSLASRTSSQSHFGSNPSTFVSRSPSPLNPHPVPAARPGGASVSPSSTPTTLQPSFFNQRRF
ncbi:hypothetical protein ACEPAI_3435 [Sanghuangporus weigelae]